MRATLAASGMMLGALVHAAVVISGPAVYWWPLFVDVHGLPGLGLVGLSPALTLSWWVLSGVATFFVGLLEVAVALALTAAAAIGREWLACALSVLTSALGALATTTAGASALFALVCLAMGLIVWLAGGA